MDGNELELVPTEDLLAELKRRTTFQGVIFRAEAKTRDWEGERDFYLTVCGMSLEEGGRLMAEGAGYVESLSWRGDS